MTILRHYKMQAAEGRGSELKAALTDLAAKVSPLSGCEKVQLLADLRDSGLYFFIEHWTSIDDHKAAGSALGKDAFVPVLAALTGSPEGHYLEAVVL